MQSKQYISKNVSNINIFNDGNLCSVLNAVQCKFVKRVLIYYRNKSICCLDQPKIALNNKYKQYIFIGAIKFKYD